MQIVPSSCYFAAVWLRQHTIHELEKHPMEILSTFLHVLWSSQHPEVYMILPKFRATLNEPMRLDRSFGFTAAARMPVSKFSNIE
jgi:hypothetical protein